MLPSTIKPEKNTKNVGTLLLKLYLETIMSDEERDIIKEEDHEDDEEWTEYESNSDEEFASLIKDADTDSDAHMQRAREAYEGLERLENIKQYLNVIAITLTGFALCFLIFFVAHDHLQQKPMVEISGLNVDRTENGPLSYDKHHPDEYRTRSDEGFIERIVILGERNSGLEQLAFRLSRCYPDIEVS